MLIAHIVFAVISLSTYAVRASKPHHIGGRTALASTLPTLVSGALLTMQTGAVVQSCASLGVYLALLVGAELVARKSITTSEQL